MDDEFPSETTPEELASFLAGADAARPWGDGEPSARAAVLSDMADELDAAVGDLVPLAATETRLATERLVGELGRTTFQLRLFAGVLDEGSYLRAAIDRPDPSWPPGPRPDLRRMLVPLGPVVVFAAGNFPFAFSVAGGDTASALAAGCPVVVKAHPGHPRLSARTGGIVRRVLARHRVPEGAFAVIYGDEAGRAAVVAEPIRAGAFTGSLQGGRALFDLAASRSAPIPFYAEMGSLNPVFVTGAAMAARGDQILSDFGVSFTLSAGQFCTKPGLLFVPSGTVTDDRLAEALAPRRSGAPLLNERIRLGYADQLGAFSGHPALRTVVSDGGAIDEAPTPTVLATTAAQLLAAPDDLLVECFGPTALVVTYDSDEELLAAAGAVEGQLVATVHGEDSDAGGAVVPALLALLVDRAGRVVWNGWPTGVSVTEAMEHGGPYPATTSPQFTSVGTAAVDRFLRPVCFQAVPDGLLPAALQDANPLGIPRRVNSSTEGG